MGRKGGKYRKKDISSPKSKSKRYDNSDEDILNDEIDAFHKQRDIVTLDVNEDEVESDDEIEEPVYDIEDDSDDINEDSDGSDEDDDFIEDESQLTGHAAKIARQQKYLRAKIGGVEDEMDDEIEEEENKRVVWSRNKNTYYDEAQSSDEELAAEEEAEALRLQREKEKTLTAEDYGIVDGNGTESDKEPTFEEISVHGKPLSKVSASKVAEDDGTTAYEEVKKDLNDLTGEEQMDVVYSSAPELVSLLSELGDAVEQLQNRVNPLLGKIRGADMTTKGGLQYMEMKHQLLLSYCQAITFYLLLKSEGQPVRDHPVISRLVEIKNLLDKMRELDKYLPQFEDTLQKDAEGVEKQGAGYPCAKSNSGTGINNNFVVPVRISEKSEAVQDSRVVDVIPLKGQKLMKPNSKQQDTEVGMRSVQMLKVRATFEENLRLKGLVTSIAKKNEGAIKRPRPLNGNLETLDDFDDDALDLDNVNHQMGTRNICPQFKKHKVVMGDFDLPNKDDIGERRRKHELRVLAGAGIKSFDDADDIPGTAKSEGDSDTDLDSQTESDLEFYKQVEEGHSSKVAQKSQMYSRDPKVSSLPEELVKGKRQIGSQIEKNRGLTRARKKLTKNPRKKYKVKYDRAIKSRQGQHREVRKPTGPYGGETSGINPLVSRSVRMKS